MSETLKQSSGETILVPNISGDAQEKRHGHHRHHPPSSDTETTAAATETTTIIEVEIATASTELPAIIGVGGGDEEELMKQFKRDELKYQDCPTHPKETRR